MKLQPNVPVTLHIQSTPAHLPIVRAALQKLCEEIGFSPEVANGVVLGVDEALANVIRHAYKGEQDKPIEIVMRPTGQAVVDGVQVCIRDFGRHVDPARFKVRDLDEVRPGGLGVHIMRQCVDALKYFRAEDGGTILSMVKKLSAPENPSDESK